MRGAKRYQTAHSDRALCIPHSKHSSESSPSLKQFTFLPWAKPCLDALFQQAEKQPCARGLLQRPLPWPALSKTLQAQAPKQSTAFQLFTHFLYPEPARGKEDGCKAAGRSGRPALHKTTWGHMKLHKAKAQIPQQVPQPIFVPTPLSIWEIIRPVFSVTANSDSLKLSSSDLYTQPVSMPFIYTLMSAMKHVFPYKLISKLTPKHTLGKFPPLIGSLFSMASWVYQVKDVYMLNSIPVFSLCMLLLPCT